MKKTKLAFFLFFLLVFTTLVYPAGPLLQSQVVLEKIGIELLSDRLEVTLNLNYKTNFNSFSLTEPNRLVIDLFQTDRFSFSPQLDVNAFGVQRIRTAINRPGVIRLVFDLLDKAPYHRIWEEGTSIKVELWYKLDDEQVEPKVVPVSPVVKEEVIEEVAEPPSTPSLRLGFGLNFGYYNFKSSVLNNYFGTGSLVPGAEVSLEYPLDQKSTLGFLCSFNFVKADGKGDYKDTVVRFSNNPVSLSLLFLKEMGQFIPFAGVGIDYNYYKLTYAEDHPAVNSFGAVWGGNIQIGTNFLLADKIRLRLAYCYHLGTDSEGEYNVVLARNEFTLSLCYWFDLLF